MSSVTSESGMASLGLGIVSPDVDPSATTIADTPGAYAGPPVTSQDALKYVLDRVLCLPKASGLRQALNAGGYMRIHQVIGMSTAAMKALSYKAKVATVNTTIGLLLSEEESLVALQGFARYRELALGRAFTPYDWEAVTEDEFNQYQGSIHPNHMSTSLLMTPAKSVSTTTPSGTPPTPVPQPPSEFLSFKRGIKRDQSLFPVLKAEKDWDDWQRRLRTQATAQGVENVLDSYFMPGIADLDLFDEQNKYMMAVFTTCVQTDYGKGLIRKYEGTNNARALFLELEKRALSSTTAILTASELLSYVTTATLGKNTWNGTTTSFVLHWEEQVRLYERYVKTHSHFSPEMKRTLLQNAVNGISDLRQVKLNADQLLQANGHHASYDDYCYELPDSSN
jgi:hypothetical protein